MFYAAKYDQIETIKQLLQAGCDPNLKDNFGKTPLHDAIERGSMDVAKVLIKEGRYYDHLRFIHIENLTRKFVCMD